MSAEVFQVVSQSSFDADVPAKPRAGRTKRTYRCTHCSRIFKRSEHCARHERVHTQERPFPCAFCERRYARKDLVKRHERSLHAEQYKRAHPEEFRRSSPAAASSVSGGEEESTGSSHGTGNPLSPLTPTQSASGHVNENFQISEETLMSNDLAISHAIQSSLDQFEPSSTGPLINNLNTPECFTFDVGFNSTGLHMEASPYTFELEESPAKRRRIEIDPQLLLEDEARISHALSPANAMVLPPQSASFSPGTLDPSLTQTVENLSSQNFPRDDQIGSQFGGFSDEYAAMFGLGSLFPALQTRTDSHMPGHLPKVQKEECFELPSFNFDQELHEKICADARTRFPSGELSEALFPSLSDLNQFFSGYLECFHRHFPILHLPSLDLMETPSPLIFAICSIGALYRLARLKSRNLFALAGTMTSYALRSGLPIHTGAPKPASLWIMQTRVLLSLGGMFSGKTNVVLRAIENLGLFAIDYRLRKSSLKQHDDDSQLNWEDWISRESSKRLLCGMFIVSSLISTTFGMNPGFSHTHDLDFEVLDEEKLWLARSAQEWISLRCQQTSTSRITVQQTMAHVIFEHSATGQRPDQISGLTMLLIMHAVNVYMRSLLQIINPSGAYSVHTYPDTGLHETLLRTAFTTLSRCQDIIDSSCGKDVETPAWTHAEGPLMFNCRGLLLIAYSRLFSDTSTFNRMSLLTDNAEDIVSAARSYVQGPQQRGPSLTKAVRTTFERLRAMVRVGHLFLRKTAALTWSLEHAVAGWDSSLLLTKWTHAVERDSLLNPPDAEEARILEDLKGLISEGESEYGGNSLAAAVAHFCGTMLNDVWVWGVTPKMGNILHQLAVAYEENHQMLFPVGDQVR